MGNKPLGWGLLAVFTLLVVSCSGSDLSTFPGDAVAIVASSDIGVGDSRLVVAIEGEERERLGSPEDIVILEVAPVDHPDQTQRAAGTFIWSVPDSVGFYRANFELSQPGQWNVTVLPTEGDPLEPAGFTVLAQTTAPGIGQHAPSAVTPTLTDLPLQELTTDVDPYLGFYELSLDEALSNGRPTVLVFSTPAYCVSSTCGPLLDNVKEIAPTYSNVNFVHVEVYTGLNDPDFFPDPAHLAPAVLSWNLPSEPWVFVIDSAGTVQARFEGVLDPRELVRFLP